MEQNEADRPQRYTWPKFVLAGVLLGITLAIFWMAALVRQVHDQRDSNQWPTTSPAPAQSAVTNPPAPTNSTTAH